MGTISKFAALSAAVDSTTATVRALDTAVRAMGSTISAEGPRMREEMSRTGQVVTDVAQKLNDANGEWQQHQLSMLERLKQLVIPFEGSDAGSQYSFDAIIQDQIDKVRAGQETAAQAIAELQRQFGSVYGTLQNTFFGSQDPSTRQFLIDLETFINSGNLN